MGSLVVQAQLGLRLLANGAIALVGGHVLAQGGEAAGAFVAGACTTGAGQLHHQIGAEGSANPRRCSALRACQRSRPTREASGLSTELSARRKPVELSNAFQLPVARAHA